MGSIEAIVKGLLLQDSSPVSVTDFLDRVIHSRNVSLAQFAKATIVRVITDQIGIVNLRTCQLLVDELLQAFPNDAGLKQISNSVASEEIRRNLTRPCVPRRAAPFMDRSEVVARLKTGKKSVFSDDFLTPRIARKAVKQPVDFYWSSEDEQAESPKLRPDQLRSLRFNCKRRYFSFWRRDCRAKSFVDKISLIVSRAKCRLFLQTLSVSAKMQRVRDSKLDESSVLTCLSRDIKLKERCYDLWRFLFVRRMECRRSQVDGVLRLFRLVLFKRTRTLHEAMSAVHEHARTRLVAEGVRSICKFVRKKILKKFSDFKNNLSVNRIARELRTVKLKSGFGVLERVIGARVAKDLKVSLSRFKLMQLNRDVTKKRKRAALKAWVRSLGLLDLRREGFAKLVKVYQKKRLRNAFSVLNGLAGREEDRNVSRAVNRLNDFVLRKSVTPPLKLLLHETVSAKKIERMSVILRGKTAATGFEQFKKILHWSRAIDTFRILEFSSLKNRLDKVVGLRALKSHVATAVLRESLVKTLENLEISKSEIDDLQKQLDCVKAGSANAEILSLEVQSIQRERSRMILGNHLQKKKRICWKEWTRTVRIVKCLTKIEKKFNDSNAENSRYFILQLTRSSRKMATLELQAFRLESVIRSTVNRRILKPSFDHFRRDLLGIYNVPIQHLSKRVTRDMIASALSQWKHLMRVKTVLRRLFGRIQFRLTVNALRNLREFSYKTELIEALQECDQWRLVSEERSVTISTFLERYSTNRSLLGLRIVFADWVKRVETRKRSISRLFVSVSYCVNRFVFTQFKSFHASKPFENLFIAGLSKIARVVEIRTLHLVVSAFQHLHRCRYERTVYLLERISRAELSQHETVMREMETAAHELQADYTSLASRSKKITERNEFLENEIVVSSSKLEHETKENEMLLLKLNDLKNLDIERRIELDRISCERRDLIEKTKLIDSLKATIDNQADEIDMLKSKLNEYVKVSTSIQFYKNKVSLQSEQIASLQSKLRESAHEEILMSSPIHSRSEDITYASSSLRGLQQAVDRSNLLRSTRRSTMEMSQISGDSSRRRRDISRR